VNPAAGVLAPAPGRLSSAQRFRRPEAADRIRIFLTGRFPGSRSTVDLVVPLALLSLVSTVGTLAAPLLRTSPLLLVALSPRLPFLALAASRIGLVPFVVVGTVRLCLADPFHFRIGQRLAPVGGTGSGGRLAARLADHALARPLSGAAVFLRPNGRHLALAGAVGLRPLAVAALDLGGTVVYLACLHRAAGLWA
jgi:hypothetical protein